MNDEPSDPTTGHSLEEISAWQIAGIKEALKSADRGEFVPEEEIEAIFAKYTGD